jgi:hypothetical protein
LSELKYMQVWVEYQRRGRQHLSFTRQREAALRGTVLTHHRFSGDTT